MFLLFLFSIYPAVPPRIHPGPKVIKVQVGHTVDLPCVVKGVPEPAVTWTKDLKKYQASPDGSLLLKTVTLEDEGTYTCTASNKAGEDEARIRVVIQGWLRNFIFTKSNIKLSILIKKKHSRLNFLGSFKR